MSRLSSLQLQTCSRPTGSIDLGVVGVHKCTKTMCLNDLLEVTTIEEKENHSEDRFIRNTTSSAVCGEEAKWLNLREHVMFRSDQE